MLCYSQGQPRTLPQVLGTISWALRDARSSVQLRVHSTGVPQLTQPGAPLPLPPQPKHVLEIEEHSCNPPAGVEIVPHMHHFPSQFLLFQEMRSKQGDVFLLSCHKKLFLRIMSHPTNRGHRGASRRYEHCWRGSSPTTGLCLSSQHRNTVLGWPEASHCPPAFLKQLSPKITQEKLKHLIFKSVECSWLSLASNPVVAAPALG